MKNNSYSRTKIVATIGPASMDREILKQMILAGVDVCRINSSHGEYAVMEQIIKTVRSINEELKKKIAILVDLQGPKIRIGDLDGGGFMIEEGSELILSSQVQGRTRELVYIKYPQFDKDVRVGDKVLVDDGKIELQVTSIHPDGRVVTKVLHGGMLSSRKGVNLPNTPISLPSLTEKDRNDLEFALSQNVEWIGLSFVRRAEDVTELKDIIRSRNSLSKVIAKIEKPEAVQNIEAIIAETDGVMVARGDLGVEMPMQEVPVIQKEIVRLCNAAAKPVIIATQMMESMLTNYRPTRAEANDVGNAVFDSADALMLSGETSVGMYPIETVRAMQQIICEVEKQESIYFRENAPEKGSRGYLPESICYTSCTLARQVEAKAIIAMTHSGNSAFQIASHRPKASIYIFTDNLPLLNTLNLLWGVRVFFYDKYESTDDTIRDVKHFLKEHNYVSEGDYVIHVASTPLNERATANMVKLEVIR